MRAHDNPGAPCASMTVDGRQVRAWHGLRYAVAERFAPARPATGYMKAAHLFDVPIFPQLPGKLAAAMGHGCANHSRHPCNPQSEDAFFLNIWAPSDAHGLPVVLFIHGGAWMTGGGAMPWYDGAKLAAQGLVVVNANYRLGPLGHLGWPDACALPIPAADLLLALQWVGEHIRALGGDSENITLMGQSAGGWYAHLLSILPQTRGLIQRVALLSMGTRKPWSAQQQIDVTRRASLNMKSNSYDSRNSCNSCDSSNSHNSRDQSGRLDKPDLRRAAVDAVLKAGMAALDAKPLELGYAPSAFLPVASADVPEKLLDPAWAARACHARAVYVRCTAHESATFFFRAPAQRNASQAQVDDALSRWSLDDLPPGLQRNGVFCGAASGLSPYRQLVAASSWRQFQRFPTQYAACLAQAGKSVQLARFEFESELDGLHSGHCFDLPFQFGNLDAWPDAPMLAGLSAERFDAISRPLIAEIAAFARASLR